MNLIFHIPVYEVQLLLQKQKSVLYELKQCMRYTIFQKKNFREKVEDVNKSSFDIYH